MKKFIFYIILIIISGNFLYSTMPCANDFSAQLYSYQGTEYFVENDKYVYLQKDLVKFGGQFQLPKQIKFNLMLAYRHNYFQEAVELDSLQISRSWKAYHFNFQIYNKQIGTGSILNNLDVMDSDYDRGILENYRFGGIAWYYKKDKLKFEAELGGNELNRILSSAGLQYQNDYLTSNLAVLYAGRSNYNNLKSFLFSWENSYRASHIFLYTAGSYENFLESERFSKSSRHNIYLESVIPVSCHWQLAASYQAQRNQEHAISWADDYSSTIIWQGSKLRQHIMFSYTETPLYLHRKYTCLTGFSVANNWIFSLNLAYTTSDIGTNYYQAGIQTEWSYNEK